MQFHRLTKLSLLAACAAVILSCGPEEGSCQTSADCAADQICNTTTNTCETQQAETCTRPGTCSGGAICDVGAGNCVFSATCTSSNQQPASCPYGQFCSGANCAEVPVASATCTNFTSSTHALSWGTGKTGPVIYEITPQTTVVSTTFCGSTSPNRYRVDVKAYWGAGTFPATGGDRALESSLHLVQDDGTEFSATNTVQNLTTSADSKQVTFTVNFCRASTTTYSAGMHFVDGNEVCVSVPGP